MSNRDIAKAKRKEVLEKSSLSLDAVSVDYSSPESEITSIYKELEQITNQFQDLFLERVLRIGEILVKQKEEIGHGHFKNWVNETLPFEYRQANNYMKIYKNRERLKSETRFTFQNFRSILTYLKTSSKSLEIEKQHNKDSLKVLLKELKAGHLTDVDSISKLDSIYKNESIRIQNQIEKLQKKLSKVESQKNLVEMAYKKYNIRD